MIHTVSWTESRCRAFVEISVKISGKGLGRDKIKKQTVIRRG